jgi:rSAM/selenodomain-associated transferase 2/rSAM/selenodomain-associated transferase 1
MAGQETIILFTRCPEPGNVKKRLVPLIGEHGAANLQRDMTMHALEIAYRLATTDKIALEVHYAGGDKKRMQTLFGKDFVYIHQAGADLGERMRVSLRKALKEGAQSVVLIGADCPGITGAILRQAFAALKGHDCVLGPALDGGYYLVGLRQDQPEIFSSIPWGTDKVLEHTLGAIQRLGLKAALLERLSDVDRPDDLHIWEEMKRAWLAPMISIVIPAINEEATIGNTIKKALSGKNVEVILADGGSDDNTRELSARMGAQIGMTQKGRALQMNEGARLASGDIVLFLHSDTTLPDDYDKDIRRALADPCIAAGAFRLSFDTDTPAMRLMALGANLRSRLFRLPYGDQALFVRRANFHEAGGFPKTPIMEDVAFVQTMKKRGRISILPSRITTSSRRYKAMGTFRTWMVNQLAMAGFFMGIPSEELAVLYRGREKSLGIWIRRLMKTAKDSGICHFYRREKSVDDQEC